MSDYFDRVERQLVRRVQEGAPQSRRIPLTLGHICLAAAVLVVIVVAGVFLAARAGPRGPSASAPAAGVTVSFTARPINPRLGLGPQIMEQTVHTLRERFAAALPGVQVQRVGTRVVVRAPNGTRATRTEILALAGQGKFEVYDWERDVIAPNGKTVASQLTSQDATALEISQGSGRQAPGDPGAGAITLPRALALASKQRAVAGASDVAGPFQYFAGRKVLLPAGWTLVQAAGGASTQVYLLRNAPSLTRYDIAAVHVRRDPSISAPEVEITLTKAGVHAFQALTAALARRGALVSGLGQTLNQHLAIAVDDRLVDVAFVDFKTYPDDVLGNDRIDITGDFTVQSARDLAAELRFLPLPVELRAAG
jgi:preprotein translocase subunit SecD